MAEAEHASGPAFLAAVTAGLEVASRLLRAIGYAEFRRRGWHSPGVIGPVGAATPAGLLPGAGRARPPDGVSCAAANSGTIDAHDREGFGTAGFAI